jgi:hypothetical protein
LSELAGTDTSEKETARKLSDMLEESCCDSDTSFSVMNERSPHMKRLEATISEKDTSIKHLEDKLE